MKKILLLATAFAFSFTMMAQNETKTKATRSLPATKVQTNVPTTKVQTTKVETPTLPTDAPKTQPVQAGPSPDDVIKVNTDKYDFGKIKQGTPVTYAFELKNISKTPVVVENTYASCGCTTPDKIVEPIAPGATVKLKVQYSAAGVGPFNKDVHIKLAGVAQEKIVHINGEVLAPEPPKEEKSNN